MIQPLLVIFILLDRLEKYMKQKIFLIGSLLLIVLAVGCSKNDIKIEYKDDIEHQFSNNYTYKFVGESEHFYFQTGKVYYNNNEREILISNFNFKKSMNKNTTYLVNLYFNNRLLYGNEYGKADMNQKEYKDVVIGENGLLGEKDKNGNVIGESDSFLETTKETFKESIKLEIIYCQNKKCYTEEMKFTYIQ